MWEWFERHWPWIGLVGALVLLAGLFGSNVFRQRRDVSRWRDPVWLSWLMVVAYLLHNFEEYGIDAKGRACCSRRGLLLFLPWIASRIWQPRPGRAGHRPGVSPPGKSAGCTRSRSLRGRSAVKV